MGNILALSRRMALATQSLGQQVVAKPKTNHVNVIFVLGATGTGKSDLAISLAKTLDGEVINADAMQLYNGLDVVTNKVTLEEQDGIPHHMLDILSPDSLSYTIHDYKDQASRIINEILAKNKLPIVVGGTNYYLDSLIWESLIPKHETSCRFKPEESAPNQQSLEYMVGDDGENSNADHLDLSSLSHGELLNLTNSLDTNYLRLHIDNVKGAKLHQLLMCVDEDTARTIHPNATRKTIRALEVLKQHGRSQSKIISDINKQAGEQSFGASMTYKDSVVLWLQCEKEVLEARLDRRVDRMMERGLIKELASFHTTHNSQLLSNPADKSHGAYTRGIFQCIGFKEFHRYLTLPAETQASKQGDKLLQQGIDAMKAATRRYAKYQNRWVRKQFFEERNPACIPPVYVFDSTDQAVYKDNVVKPAVTLIDELLRGASPSRPRFAMETKAKQDNEVVYMTCDACGVTCIRRTEWQSHIHSKKHHKRLASIKKTKINLARAHLSLSEILTRREKVLAEAEDTEHGDDVIGESADSD